MTHLSTEQMVIVAETFQESLQHVLSNYLGETKTDIQLFVAEIVLKNKPYMLVTEEGLQHAVNLVFTNEQHRDFIFTLAFTFFARWGESDMHVTGLAENLARGTSQVHHNLEYNAVPDQLTMRLSTMEDTKLLLEANKWLMIVFLLQLFIGLDVPAK